MGTRGQVTPAQLANSLLRAKTLVAEHCDPALPPGERLREIGKKLKVTQIAVGAVDSSGYLSKQTDGTFAVFYANDMLERRRFTVAHELAHVILDKYHKHLCFGQSNSKFLGHSWSIEKAVDRIAAELLMPETLAVPLIKTHCELERRGSPTGLIDKRKVVRAVGKALGVSEWAFVLRLLELTDLLAVRLEFERESASGVNSTSRIRVSQSPHGDLRIVTYEYPDSAVLEQENTWELPVIVSTTWGRRTIRCYGWRRTGTDPKRVQTWVVGWSWNISPLPSWDDSAVEHTIKGV
jgi:Zn-dependent peptidase ImmA (M78 family)